MIENAGLLEFLTKVCADMTVSVQEGLVNEDYRLSEIHILDIIRLIAINFSTGLFYLSVDTSSSELLTSKDVLYLLADEIANGIKRIADVKDNLDTSNLH